jgi:hypothetical protein
MKGECGECGIDENLANAVKELGVQREHASLSKHSNVLSVEFL